MSQTTTKQYIEWLNNHSRESITRYINWDIAGFNISILHDFKQKPSYRNIRRIRAEIIRTYCNQVCERFSVSYSTASKYFCKKFNAELVNVNCVGKFLFSEFSCDLVDVILCCESGSNIYKDMVERYKKGSQNV
jgi:hypothetical protein